MIIRTWVLFLQSRQFIVVLGTCDAVFPERLAEQFDNGALIVALELDVTVT